MKTHRASLSRFSCTLAATILAVGTSPAASSAPWFSGLGFLHGGDQSYARGVSADGSVVVGEAHDSKLPAGGAQAVRWTQAQGIKGLGFVDLGTFSMAWGVSGDGQVVAGFGDYNATGFWGILWDAQGANNLGWRFPHPRSASFDGRYLAGSGVPEQGSMQACRWSAEGGLQLLGVLHEGGFGDGWGISADGQVVVGTSSSLDGSRAVRWTPAGGLQSLGLIAGAPYGHAEGRGISADGKTLVGVAYDGLRSEPFRWTEAEGMKGLGFPSGGENGVAVAASGDGSIIVGMAGSAFIWDANHGIRNLKEVLMLRYQFDLADWTLTEATAISADALTIVGNGQRNGKQEGWVARVDNTISLPELKSALRAGELLITWPHPSPGWTLTFAASLETSAQWQSIPGPYERQVKNWLYAAPPPSETRFYRLARQAP